MIYCLPLIFNCFVISATTPIIEIPNKECFEHYFINCPKPIALYVYTIGKESHELLTRTMSFYNTFERCAENYRNIQFLSVNRGYGCKESTLYKILNLEKYGIDLYDVHSRIFLYGYSDEDKKHFLIKKLFIRDRDKLSEYFQSLPEH